MTVQYYVPLKDSTGASVIDPTTGAAVTSTDTSSAQGTWTPLNPNDTTGVYSSNTATHVLNDRSLATQKTVSDVTNPDSPATGDTLQYTVSFEVSDYFAFQNLILTDLISDGQHFDTTFTPTLQVNGGTFTLATQAMNGANYTVTGNYTGATPPPTNPDGTITVAFRISDEMVTRGQNGQLIGGLVSGSSFLSAPGNGPVTGTITFRTVIQNRFTNTYPSGEPTINQGDVLNDNVTIGGDVLANATLTTTGSQVTDGSAAKVTIVQGSLTKSIYAVNGSTNFTSPPKIAAGDTVTYEIKYHLPLASEEQLAISDFLPLPIFDATTVTTLDSTESATAPASGHAQYGPSDTFHNLSSTDPNLASSGIANSLTFTYPTYKDPNNGSATIDLLFTVTASNAPFADGLFLTNQAHLTEGTTNSTSIDEDAIVQIKMTEPVLTVSKGAVATNDPSASITGTHGPAGFTSPGSSGFRATSTMTSSGLASSPLNSNATGIQANDLVTFAVVVQNTGSGLHGAFNVEFKDTLPAGFAIPTSGLNLSVTDGTGNTLPYTDLGGGLFGSGLGLTDGNGTGALSAYSASDGNNLVVITYDLKATTSVAPAQTYTNTASVFNYASQTGGPNFLSSPITASANATVPNVGVAKVLASSNQSFTTGDNLAIGEVGTYTDTLTFPEGTTPSAHFLDQLPAGLALVSLSSITPSTNLAASAGTFNAILSAATIPSNGSSFTLNFGNIVNSDTTLGGSDTVVITYKAVVTNIASNTQGKSLTNTATLTFTGGSNSASQTAKVVLPVLTVSKSIDNASAQAGDTVTYTIVVSNLSANGSATDAFDLSLADTLPADITYVAGSLANTNGVVPSQINVGNGSFTVGYNSLPLGSTSTLTFQAKVNTGVAALTPVTNTASLTYTTLAGVVNTPTSTYDPNSVERTGNTSDPGGAANNLATTGSALFTPPASVSKTIVSTNQAFTSGNNVAIGEEVQYQLVVTIPQGTTPSAVISDTLPAGLVFDSDASDSFSPALSSTASGGLAGALASPSHSNNVVTWDLGTVTNTDTNSATAETITINYNVYVLNVSSNQSGVTLTNNARFSTSGGSATASAPALSVVVPKLDLTESPSSSTADIGGSPVTFTVSLSHDAASTADAFDLNLGDLVPTGFTVVPGSFQYTGGVVPTSINQSGNTLSATYASLALGQTSTLTFQANLNGTVSPAQKVTDTPSITYTTLPGNVTTAQSANSPVSTERTGNTSDPGNAANDLVTNASADVTATSDSISGLVYVDTNNDGTKQAGESGIPGVTVSLSGTDILNRPVTATTTTLADGSYTFGGLVPGSYTITETQPSSYFNGKDTFGTPSGTNTSQDVLSVTFTPSGSSVSALNYNFGELAPSSLSGYVYVDGNNDGIKQASESGIGGVTITLTGTDYLNNPVSATTTTQNDGSYSFGNLAPGTYTITETQPAGYLEGKDTIGTQGGSSTTQDVFSNIVVTSGTTGTNNNFGELGPTSLSGSVYVDAKNDRTRQAGESGIGDVTMALMGTDDLNNAVSLTTTTQQDGSYNFSNLRPGTYTITETQPAGYLEGKDTIGTQGGSSASQDVFSNVVVTAGTVGTNNDFGELVPSNLSGFVYVDLNNDGIKQAGESGIGGVTIALTGTDDLNKPVSTTTTTQNDGSYSFGNLRPGTYTITETQPAGYLEGKDTIGTQGGSSATEDVFSNIVVASGTTGVKNNFGEVGLTVTGTVFVDAEATGTLAPTDQGVGGVTVNLLNANHVVIGTTTTASDGSYSFAGLPTGNYTLVEEQPNGYGSSTPKTLDVTLSSTGSNNQNFGQTLSSLAGLVYLDSNNDGRRQPSEVGIGGVTVWLTGTEVNGQPVSLTTTTASDGTYRFTGLLAGTYTVTETQPAGYVGGKIEAGSSGGVVSSNAIGTISLPAGQNGVNYNFAELRTSSISGIVYYDYDHNGTYGANDFGIVNVPVSLIGTNDLGQRVSLSTTTGKYGNYSFDGLFPGTYTITESAPKVFITGPTNPGTTGGMPGVGTLSNVTLTPGVPSMSNNFAEWQRPGCDLADLAFHVGRSFAQDTKLYDANPAQFQALHPKLAAFLAAGEVPRGVGTYPNAVYSYSLVPTLGTKVVPYEPWVGRVKVKNGRILPAAKAAAAPLHVSSTSHPEGPLSRPRTRH